MASAVAPKLLFEQRIFNEVDVKVESVTEHTDEFPFRMSALAQHIGVDENTPALIVTLYIPKDPRAMEAQLLVCRLTVQVPLQTDVAVAPENSNDSRWNP